jgi:hypothetical protein
MAMQVLYITFLRVRNYIQDGGVTVFMSYNVET